MRRCLPLAHKSFFLSLQTSNVVLVADVEKKRKKEEECEEKVLPRAPEQRAVAESRRYVRKSGESPGWRKLHDRDRQECAGHIFH